ncbi:MAG: hypothetical protein ACYDH4_12015 [Candidatus Cryosericum sp.]
MQLCEIITGFAILFLAIAAWHFWAIPGLLAGVVAGFGMLLILDAF